MQALKEWAVVCKALEEGRQVVLLRKGGILEYRQGFEVKHDRFLLFPTFEHQSPAHIQPDYSGRVEQTAREAATAAAAATAVAVGTGQGNDHNDSINGASGRNVMTAYAEAVSVKEVSDRSVLKKLERYHIWNESYVNARMDYNPRKPMSVILLRVFRLDRPIVVETQEEWAGCKSWIPLEIDVASADHGNDYKGGRPVLGDSEFARVASEVKEVLSVAA